MHYGDIGQEEANIIKIVVYQHEIWEDFKPTGKGDTLKTKSIQSCQFVDPELVESLINWPDHYIDADKLEFDNWYLVTLKQIEESKLKVISIENVTNSENKYYRLH